MRQMPSVTVTTVPWVRTSAASERFWILLRIRSLISDGLSCCIVAPGSFYVPSSFEEGWRHPSSLALLPHAGEGNILLPSPLRGEGSGVRSAPGWLSRVPPPPPCGGPLLLKGGGDKKWVACSCCNPHASSSAATSSRLPPTCPSTTSSPAAMRPLP